MSNKSIFEFEFQLGGTITPDMKRAFDQAQRQMGNMETKSAKTMKALKVGAGIAVAAFAAVGAGIGKAVKSASEFQDSLAQVQAATGASMQEMKKMKDITTNLYNKNLGEDFNDLTEAVTQARQVTQLQGKELENVTEKAILYRDVFGEEVSQSIKATDTMMKNFGITSNEAYNLLAQGAQNGLNKSDELIDSANEYAPYFSTLGFSANEMFDSFSNGLKNGAFNLDKVGDAVKEFGIRSKDGSKASMEAYAELGLNAEELTQTFAKGGNGAKKAFKDVTNAIAEVEDPVKQSQIAVSLFGTQAEDLEMKVITSMGNVGKTFDGTKNTMNEIKKTKFDTLGSAFQTIGRQLNTGFVIPLGNALLPALQSVSNVAKLAIPKVAGYFSNTFAVVKNVVSGVSTYLKTNNGFSNYFQIVKTIFGGIKSTVSIFAPYVKQALGGIVSFAKVVLAQASTFWSANGQQIMGAVRNVFGVIKSVISFVMPFVAFIVKSVWGNIKGVIIGAIKVISGVIKVFSSLFTGDFRGMWQGVKQIFVGSIQLIWNYFQLMFYGKLIKGIGIVAKSSVGFIRGMWSSIKGSFINGIKAVNDRVVGFGRAVGNGFRSAKDSAVGIMKGLWSGTKDYFTKIVQTAKELPGKMGQGIKDNAKKALSGITSMGNDLLVGIGKIVNGVINGLNWVGGKVGIDAKISTWNVPKYANGTNGHPGGLAVLGDGGGPELFKTPNGRVGLSPGTDTLMNLPSGTQVIPHRETAKIMSTVPKYAFGTGIKDALGTGADWVSGAYGTTKEAVSNAAGVVADTVGTVSNKVSDTVGDVMDVIGSPTKVFEKILGKFGVSEDIVGAAGYMSKIGKAGFNYVKDGALKYITDKISIFDQGGGEITNSYGIYDSLYNIAQTIMNSPLGKGLSITSGHREGDPHDHGKHNAVDLSGFGSNGGYLNVAKWASKLPGVSYAIGDNTVFGRKYGNGSKPDWAKGHMNHLHVSGNGGGGGTSGSANSWAKTIKQAAKQMKVKLTDSELNGIIAQIHRESTGNQNVIQSGAVKDINTATGNPAKGLLQYVPATFKRYAKKGHNNIFSGMDQLLAFFNNSNWRSDLPYGKSGWHPSGKRRFESGGDVNTNGSILVGENGPEILRNRKGSRVLNTNKTQSLLENINTFKNNNLKKSEPKTIQISAPYSPVIQASGSNIDYDTLEKVLKSDHQRFKEMMKKLINQIAADDMNVAFDDSF